MKNRMIMEVNERDARSRLTKIVHDKPFIIGSLVIMKRKCGYKGCKCAKGKKHVSLYLAFNDGKRRKLLCIPKSLEPIVDVAVKTYNESKKLSSEISLSTLKRIINEKKKKID